MMMYAKAVEFGDQPTAAKILASPDPKEQKRLGRLVTPSNWLATWSLLEMRLHARYLEEALPGVSESQPSRRPRL